MGRTDVWGSGVRHDAEGRGVRHDAEGSGVRHDAEGVGCGTTPRKRGARTNEDLRAMV